MIRWGKSRRMWSARRSGAAVFNPLSLSPTVWYDPSDLSTLFQDSAGTTPVTASGQPVGKMLDKSGNGNHAIQATAGARPTYTVSGGSSFLLFDGVANELAAAFATAAPFDRVSAIRRLANTSFGYFFASVVGTNSGVLYDNGANSLTVYDGSTGPTTSLTLATDAVITERHDNTNSRVAIDNAAYTTGTSGAGALSGLSLGKGAGSAENFRMYGVVMVSRYLTNSETANLRTYMGAKQGRAL